MGTPVYTVDCTINCTSTVLFLSHSSVCVRVSLPCVVSVLVRVASFDIRHGTILTDNIGVQKKNVNSLVIPVSAGT